MRDERKGSLMKDHEENDIGNKKRETLMRTFDEKVNMKYRNVITLTLGL